MSVEEAGFRFLLVSVKILINWFLRGIQIQKDGVRSKPQIFRGLDGWYASNIITRRERVLNLTLQYAQYQ